MSEAAARPAPEPEPPAVPLVQLRNVFCVHRSAHGDAAALQGATLRVGHGEVVCVLGPSGAGKSTLLRVIAGLQIPSAGDALLGGVDIGRLSARRRMRIRREEIGFLSQFADAALPPDLRVGDCVALPLTLRGLGRSARAARVRELLEVAGLADRVRAFPRELSGGERQRVALCAALAHRPALLLADEPTAELDASSATNVLELIAELAASGTTAVIVSHDPQSASIADRTLLIRDGRVAEAGSKGSSALVVGRDGWLRLPPELLSAAGIEGRATVAAAAGGLVLAPAGEAAGDAANDVPASRSGAVPDPDSAPAAVRVELTEVTQTRGGGRGRRTVLDAISGTLGPGALIVISGRSGAGKTTLLRLIAGLDRADSGRVQLGRETLGTLDTEARARLRRELIGYLAQEPSPVPFLSAEENVILGLQLRGWEISAARAAAAVVLSRVGLADRARQRVGQMSAGENQRVALARALAGARGLLLVDEPTSRLDRANATDVAELLHDAAVRRGQTVICATHDEQLMARADRLFELRSGHLAELAGGHVVDKAPD